MAEDIGATSALDLRSYSHFVALGKPMAYLFTSREQRLPSWMTELEWDMTVKSFTTSIFAGEQGLETLDYQGHQLLISGPEMAFMECLHLAPSQFALLDLYYVMEMLTTLRPKLVQKLLEGCSSVKVKRLFLYMAQKAGHQWFKALDLSKIDLGTGKHLFAESGRYISEYLITIPAELADYE